MGECINGFDTDTFQPCNEAAAEKNLRIQEFLGQDGLIYYQPVGADGRPTGEPYTYNEPAPQKGGGTSSSYNVSERGPNDLALQRDEMAQRGALALEENRLKQRELELRSLSDAENARYLRDKMGLEREQGDRAALQASEALYEQISARQASNSFQRAQLMFEAASTQAQMDFAASRANAEAQVQAQEINERRRASNLEQRRGVARDIADFSRNPGDVAANAAYLTAGGASPLSTALGQGADARTAQSLMPLDLLLGTQTELAQGPQLFTAPTITAPRVAMPSFGDGFGGLPPRPAPGGYPSGGGGGGAAPAQNYAGAYGAGTWNAGNANTGFVGSVDAGGNLVATPTGMADGGMTTDRLFVGNERGPELFANPTGAPIGVVPADQTRQMLNGFEEGTGYELDPRAMSRMNTRGQLREFNDQGAGNVAASMFAPGGEKMRAGAGTARLLLNLGDDVLKTLIPKGQTLASFRKQLVDEALEQGLRLRGFADGTGFSAVPTTGPRYDAPLGLFDTAQPAATTPAAAGAGTPSTLGANNPLGFLNTVTQRARQGSPWQYGNLPTPVGVSAPGTNAFLQQYAASLAASGAGINPGLFLSEAQALAPVGLSGAPTRRSR